MDVRPLHRSEVRRILWGAGVAVVLVIVGTLGAIVQVGGALPLVHYTYVKARFTNIGTLNVNKQVKQNGLQVGVVSGIAYDNGSALVTLRLNGDHAVYANATAAVSNANILGKKYVSFDPGTPSAGPLKGNTLSVRQTTASQSLEDILATFDPATRAALRSSLNELGTGVVGHGGDLNALLANAPALLTQLKSVSTALTSSPADVPGLVASANALLGRFQGREAQFAALMRNARATMDAVGTDHGVPLRQTIAGLPATLRQARSVLDGLNKPLTDANVALTDLRPGTSSLGAATPALRSFLREVRSPLDKVPSVAGLAKPALGDLTTTLADARPLVRPLTVALDGLDQFLAAFAPYAPDAGRFFSQDALLAGTLGGNDAKHYFAAALTSVGLASVAGVPDPLYRSEPYPCPGAAWNHAIVSNCSGGAR